VVALVCLEATSEDRDDEDTASELHDYKSLQAVLSRLKENFKSEEYLQVEIPDHEEPVETTDHEEPVETTDHEEPVGNPNDEVPE
jgi:hypothetical protein